MLGAGIGVRTLCSERLLGLITGRMDSDKGAGFAYSFSPLLAVSNESVIGHGVSEFVEQQFPVHDGTIGRFEECRAKSRFVEPQGWGCS